MPVTDDFTAELEAATTELIDSKKPDVDPEPVEPVDPEPIGTVDPVESDPVEPVDPEPVKPVDPEPVDPEPVDPDPDPEPVKSTPPAVPISDATLGAAVRAGIDLGSARQFPSELSLQQAVASMDAARESYESVEEEEDQFKDMKLDPEKYEPEVVEMYDSLVSVIKKQHDELRELKTQTAD